jgi:hypothetical protein
MRPSAIDVQVVRNFTTEMVELVEAGELASKTVNNTSVGSGRPRHPGEFSRRPRHGSEAISSRSG